MEAEINLNEVEEKPLLPADQEMTLNIYKCELKLPKEANKKTGLKEPYFACEIAPMDPQWAGKEYKIYHNWSTSVAGLSSPDPLFSMKKFFTVVGHKWRPDGKVSTEEFQTITFIGKLRYDDKRPTFPQLGAVLRGVQ